MDPGNQYIKLFRLLIPYGIDRTDIDIHKPYIHVFLREENIYRLLGIPDMDLS